MDRETADPIAMMAAQLSRLPGIGRKTATRLAYFIAAQPEEDVRELASALATAGSACRPPWVDTHTADAPAATQRAASSPRSTPLTTTGSPDSRANRR